MKKEISAILDKVLSKGMEIMESERAQQILATPQAQKALDLGMAALTKANETADVVKAVVASKLGLYTQKEVDELREIIAKLEAEKAAASDGCCCCDSCDCADEEVAEEEAAEESSDAE